MNVGRRKDMWRCNEHDERGTRRWSETVIVDGVC